MNNYPLVKCDTRAEYRILAGVRTDINGAPAVPALSVIGDFFLEYDRTRDKSTNICAHLHLSGSSGKVHLAIEKLQLTTTTYKHIVTDVIDIELSEEHQSAFQTVLKVLNSEVNDNLFDMRVRGADIAHYKLKRTTDPNQFMLSCNSFVFPIFVTMHEERTFDLEQLTLNCPKCGNHPKLKYIKDGNLHLYTIECCRGFSSNTNLESAISNWNEYVIGSNSVVIWKEEQKLREGNQDDGTS